MSATDELRRLLDERGVEWMPSVFDPQHETFYDVNGVGFIVTEFPEIERLSLACDMRITPAQAIAATLGRETCRRLPADNYGTTCIVRGHGYEMEFGYWKCSECGTNCFEGARYCMNCGAKVVDERARTRHANA